MNEMNVQFAVVERILEKHSTTALMLSSKQLDVSALQPRPRAPPLVSCEIDRQRLLFSHLPSSVDTDSFKKYLQRASPSHDQLTITSVIYGMQRGIAMAVFQQPYGKQICVLLANKCERSALCVVCLRDIAVCMLQLCPYQYSNTAEHYF